MCSTGMSCGAWKWSSGTVLGWVILGHLDTVHPAQKTHFPQKSHLTCTRDSTAVLGHQDRTPGEDIGTGHAGTHGAGTWNPGTRDTVTNHAGTCDLSTWKARMCSPGTCDSGTRHQDVAHEHMQSWDTQQPPRRATPGSMMLGRATPGHAAPAQPQPGAFPPSQRNHHNWIDPCAEEKRKSSRERP